MIRKNMRGFGFLAAVLLLGGMAGCREKQAGRQQQPPAQPVTTIPAKNVRFHLVKPDKEKRSGLYAMGQAQTPEIPELFALLANGKVGKPTEGKTVVLVGKLPDVIKVAGKPAACTTYDFFQSEDGTIRGNEITIPVKFVRWMGEIEKVPGPRAVYFTVTLPALPVGKYRAEVTFEEHICTGDRSDIVGSLTSAERFAPLTCKFEVKQKRFRGRVEMMGRCPDRFDYLYDAARAHCYAAGDAAAEHKTEALRKAQEYHQGWKNYHSPKGRRRDFYTRFPDSAGYMVQKYRAVLKAYPKHPLKKDLLVAIGELEKVHAKKKQAKPEK